MDWGQVTNMCAGNKFTNVWPGMPPWTIRPISRKASDKYNVPFCSRIIHICAHFCGKMVHCGIFLWCIVGFVRWVFHIYAQYHTAQATDSWNGGWLVVTGNGSWCMGIKGDMSGSLCHHDDVIKWKHFPRYWPFVRGIHRSPVNSPYKGQWRRSLMFSLICAWINDWVNNAEPGDLRRHHAHYDVTVMTLTWNNSEHFETVGDVHMKINHHLPIKQQQKLYCIMANIQNDRWNVFNQNKKLIKRKRKIKSKENSHAVRHI